VVACIIDDLQVAKLVEVGDRVEFTLFFIELSIRSVEGISNLMRGKSEIRRRAVRSTSPLNLLLASWCVRPGLVAEVRRC
jgi:hypothetical protein